MIGIFDLFSAKEIVEYIAICFGVALTIFCIGEFLAWVISGMFGVVGELIKSVRGRE